MIPLVASVLENVFLSGVSALSAREVPSTLTDHEALIEKLAPTIPFTVSGVLEFTDVLVVTMEVVAVLALSCCTDTVTVPDRPSLAFAVSVNPYTFAGLRIGP
jgi:hypothetical protein